nr:glyceraldehyde 3-phosphate dehydrogenase NAD-binding domain-containing protein [bacterium]
MTSRIAINGFGRIGRQVFRLLEDEKSLEAVAINDLTSPSVLAHLLKYDSVHGRFPGTVEAADDAIVVNGRRVSVTSVKNPAELPWKEDRVDIVVEATGVFRSAADLEMHLRAGARKVLLTVPPKKDPEGRIMLVVMGVNDDKLGPDQVFVSNASCTTNCLAPLAKVIDRSFGIRRG